MRTKLPKEWCVNPKNRNQDKILKDWRGGGYAGTTKNSAVCSDKYWIHYPSDRYEEITFEEFQILVLKEPNLEQHYEIY